MTEKTPQGAPAGVAGRNFAEVSHEVIREGFTDTETTLVSQGVPVVPVVSREEALADEAKRQKADDERRVAFHKAEKAAAEAAEKARLAAIKGV